MQIPSLLALWALLGGFHAMSRQAWAQRTLVGPEACAACHVDQAAWMRGGVHEKASTRAGNNAPTGCETCHGPGSEHGENPVPDNIITFRTEPAKQRAAQCLACHDAAQPNLNFVRGDHSTAKVSCDQCHTARGSERFHAMRAVQDSMSGAEPGLCYDCHAGQRADFALPFHHPVKEGFMECSSCHEPHGDQNLRQLRSRGTEAICGKCHAGTQGPFIFEHPSGRATGCQGCHRPHGSTNSKMLIRHQVRLLCLECHANTTFTHDLSQVHYQNCTVCHSRIHGSNLNRLLLR